MNKAHPLKYQLIYSYYTMYRTCIASLCFSNCCDYYAYCVYPNQTPFCYSNVTYYYYDYTWVWIVCTILFVLLVISIIGAFLRRRRLMRARGEMVVEANTMSPSVVQGQPVYGVGNPYGAGPTYDYYRQPNTSVNQPLNNQGYGR